MSDVNSVLLEPLAEFYRDSKHLVMQCNKPDREEFAKVARATGIGFLIMGFIGFFVKVIHIPINNILIGGM
jgi:protein transport protein SEC61 subunit gamma and related proteins